MPDLMLLRVFGNGAPGRTRTFDPLVRSYWRAELPR